MTVQSSYPILREVLLEYLRDIIYIFDNFLAIEGHKTNRLGQVSQWLLLGVGYWHVEGQLIKHRLNVRGCRLGLVLLLVP